MTPGITVGGKYRLLRLLGEGAMGEVWAAVNESTGGEVALKLLSRPREELRHRLLREARACGKLRHRNVIDIHDVGQTDDGEPFLVMALLHGETLADLISRKRRLEPHHAAQIARDIARALTAAHKAGIVHRDLKPANVFLHREEGADDIVVKVLDFGVSKNLDIYDGLSTIAGATVGSPAYMSPEQARTSPDLDHRADLWAVGVVLFEMLTGKRPFEGDAQQVLVKIAMGPIPLVSQLVRNADPGLVALVARCLERDPQKRFASAEELVAELDRFTRPTMPAPAPSIPASSTPAPSVPTFNPRTTTQGPRASLGPDHEWPANGPRSRANSARPEASGEDDQPTMRWNRAMLQSMMSASVAPPGSSGDPVDAGAPTLLDPRETAQAAPSLGHTLPLELPPLGVPPAPRFGVPPPLPDLPLVPESRHREPVRLGGDPTETPSHRTPPSAALSSVAPLVHPSPVPTPPPEAPRDLTASRAPAPRLWPPLAAALALGAVMVVLALGLVLVRTIRTRPPVSATPAPNAVTPIVEPSPDPPAPAPETTSPPEVPPPDPPAAPKAQEAPAPTPSATATAVKPAPKPTPLPHRFDIARPKKSANNIIFPKLR